MKKFARSCTAILYSASLLLYLAAGTRTATAQSATFSPVEQPIILPAAVEASLAAGGPLGSGTTLAVDTAGNIFLTSHGSQVIKRSTSGVITTISSSLGEASDIKTDAAGNVYVVDDASSGLTKITPAGVQTVLASGVNFQFHDFVVDGSGNIFIGDNTAGQVVKVSPSGTQTVLATGLFPTAIALDAGGNLYVADTPNVNRRVVKIAPSGAQTVVATGFNNFPGPGCIAVNSSGNVLVIDSTNVVKITPSGLKTTVFDGLSPTGGGAGVVAVDGADNIYLNLGQNPNIIELKNTTTAFGEVIFGGSQGSLIQPVTFTFHGTVNVGKVQVLTNGAPSLDFQSASGGTCAAGTFSNGQTCTVNVQFSPTQAGARLGAVVLSDPSGNPLSTVDLNGIGLLEAVALNPGVLEDVLNSGLLDPSAVAVDGLGNTFIVDKGHSRVVKLSPSGIQTVLGSGLSSPTGVAEDGAGNIFISDTANDRVVRVTPNGGQTTILSGLTVPEGIAMDGAGNLYVADSGSNRVLKLAADGATLTTVGSGYSRPTGVTVDGVGDVFVADFGNNRIVEVAPDGTQSTVIGNLSHPSGVAADAIGKLYVAEVGTNTVIEVTIAGGTRTTVITSGLNFPFDAVLFAVNGSGNVFIADTFNNRVLQVVRSQSNLTFGSVTVGQTSSLTVTVENVGDVLPALGLGGAGTAFSMDANDVNFQLVQQTSASNDCLQAFSLPDTCSLLVSFTPKTKGNLTGTVTITDQNFFTQIGVIHLSGTGN